MCDITTHSVSDAPISLFLRPSTSNYIWVLADTTYKYGYSMLPLVSSEPVNSLFQWEFEHYEIERNVFLVRSRKEGALSPW